MIEGSSEIAIWFRQRLLVSVGNFQRAKHTNVHHSHCLGSRWGESLLGEWAILLTMLVAGYRHWLPWPRVVSLCIVSFDTKQSMLAIGKNMICISDWRVTKVSFPLGSKTLVCGCIFVITKGERKEERLLLTMGDEQADWWLHEAVKWWWFTSLMDV